MAAMPNVAAAPMMRVPPAEPSAIMHLLDAAAARFIGQLLRHGRERRGGKRGGLGRRATAEQNRKAECRGGNGRFYDLHI